MVRASPESSTEVFEEFGRTLFLSLFTVISRVYLTFMIIYLPLRWVLRDRFWLIAFINNYGAYLFLPLLIILPIGLVLRRRWVVILSAILVVIGVIWGVPYFVPKRVLAATGPTLSVVSFDVGLTNADLTGVKDWLLETDADVILLQGVNKFQIRKGQLSGSSIRYPFQQGVFFSNDDIPWGNFILSRYPISKIDKLDIKNTSALAMHQRYEIDVNGQIVAVYNARFDYPLTPGGVPRIVLLISTPLAEALVRYDPAGRDNQIREFLSQVENETRPFVVAGSFNMSDQTEIYREVARQMRDSFLEAGFGLGATWELAPGEGLMSRLTSPLFRVDYIWHGDGLRAVNMGQGPRGLGSDHLPVYATLELTGD